MASKTEPKITAPKVTDRDYEILEALKHTPLDRTQLLRLSSTFKYKPFGSEDAVRKRMEKLERLGLLVIRSYATTAKKSHPYHQLTIVGYRFLEGHTTNVPRPSFFSPIKLGSQPHTQSVADAYVIVHVSAHRMGFIVNNYQRENQCVLKLPGGFTLKTDGSFELLAPSGRRFSYHIEVDNSSEPVCTSKNRESLEQKTRFYDVYRDRTKERFMVLYFFAKSEVRMHHFCQESHAFVRNPNRQLFYAAFLRKHVHADVAATPLFQDRHLKRHPLVPREEITFARTVEEPRRANHDLLLANVPSV